MEEFKWNINKMIATVRPPLSYAMNRREMSRFLFAAMELIPTERTSLFYAVNTEATERL
jgi:hypothetical protein